MKYTDFISSLNQQLSSHLESMGFKNLTDNLFVRFSDSHEINVISIQKHSSDPTVCVNFGVHYDFLPKVASSEPPCDGLIELSNCEVKIRLTPNPSEKDYWWPIATNSIYEIADLINFQTSKFFYSYNLDGDISTITPSDLNEDLPDIIAMLTKVRAGLLLAHIHEALGNTEKAASFAKFGIKEAGMAVGPKKILREILQRVEKKS
jgi:hypothetical protein